MKKNFAMRIAACLLVVTMLSLCMVSYTYAKYTTSDNSTDTARVAKWGVNVEVELSDLFEDAYLNGSDTTVESSVALTDLVAPGTEGTLTAIKISGTPEVSTSIESVVDLVLDGWLVDGNYYCPLEFTIDTTTYKGLDYASADLFEEAVETAIKNAIEETHNPNESIADEVKVAWSWAFDTNDDYKDTVLGDAAADGNAATVQLDIKVTVNQVD